MKNMVTTEEALKELISRVPDEVLSEAIGGMSAGSRNRLIKLGLVAAVAAAGYGGYCWHTRNNEGSDQHSSLLYNKEVRDLGLSIDTLTNEITQYYISKGYKKVVAGRDLSHGGKIIIYPNGVKGGEKLIINSDCDYKKLI